MSVRVFLDDSDARPATVYVERDERGPLTVLLPSGQVDEHFDLPDDAAELVHPDDAVASVLERIEDVSLSKTAREAIATRLGVDVEQVGTAAPVKPRKTTGRKAA